MELPFFYIEEYREGEMEITLDEDNSRHIIQVLRMAAGERLRLTDGKGSLLTAVIADAHKKKCRVRIESAEAIAPRANKVTIAISILKNASRFEWFLEKAAEIGVSGVIPLICERTERSHFRMDRMKGILVSAMLQSQQCWLPTITDPMPFRELMPEPGTGFGRKLIAHCVEEERLSLAGIVRNGSGTGSGTKTDSGAGIGTGTGKDIGSGEDSGTGEGKGVGESSDSGEGSFAGEGVAVNTLILIGPEGDFSKQEIELALAQDFKAVTLGETRLRTETAGVVAAALLCVEG